MQEAFTDGYHGPRTGHWEFLSGMMAGTPGSLLSNADPPHTLKACGSTLCPPAFWGAWLKGAGDGQYWDEAHPMREGKIKSNAETSFSFLTS